MREAVLRPLCRADADRLLRWRNSERVRSCMYTDHVITEREHKAWIERILSDSSRRDLIFELGKRPVGLSSFVNIDLTKGTCTWGFYLGETDLPRGSGTLLGACAMTYVFETLGLVSVNGEVLDSNNPSRRLFERLGFDEVAIAKDHVFEDGRRCKVIVYELPRESWAARQRSEVVTSA